MRKRAILQERAKLLDKLFCGGLTAVEELRLAWLRKELDRIDPLNAILQQQLEALDA